MFTAIDCVCINTVAADCLELLPQNSIGVKKLEGDNYALLSIKRMKKRYHVRYFTYSSFSV